MTNLEHLSCEEKKAIEELRTRMKNALPDNLHEGTTYFLFRFLKARDFDVDKAEKMLRNTLSWRKSFQVDSILKDFQPKEFFHKYTEVSHIGLDRDGDMVKYSPWGKLDGRDILNCVKMNDYMKHWIWHSEQIRKELEQLKEKTGRISTQLTFIVDLDELTIGNATSRLSAESCIRLLHIIQDNYPECLKSMYVINAPSYYKFIFTILKAMMSNALLQKIHFYGYSGWKEKLLEIIDADVLPAFLGGNRTDPDGNPLCSTFVTHGGKIAEKYYLPDAERSFKNKSHVKQLLVPEKKKNEIEVEITESGSLIQWEFLVKKKDIGFGLFYKASASELKEVLPIQRYDTIDGTEEGSYKSQATGNYIVVFDNSYSWLYSKQIEYCITVIKPEL